MDKSYFYVNNTDLPKVRKIFSAMKLDFQVCRAYSEAQKSLVSFRSTPDEQKAVMKRIKDNEISCSVI